MPSNKKKRKTKVTKNDPTPTFIDQDNSNQGDAYISPFVIEDSIKPNFTDEFDLFSYFFNYLRETRHLMRVVKLTRDLRNKEPNKLHECTPRNYSSDPKFIPMKFDRVGNDFFNTSSRITIKFNELNKRVLETNCKIKRGDIVSVERALILTDKPNTTAEKFSVYRCHHCLRVISYFVTCPYCDVAIFCSYNCRNSSWYEYHVWECYGLQRDFWDISSLEYLAMRMLLLGAKFEFNIEDEEFDSFYNTEPNIYVDMNTDLTNSYKYIYKLTYNLKNKSNLELGQILMKCAGILVYLIECTYFFKWFSKLPNFENKKPYELYEYIGGLLLRHYSQAEIHHIQCPQIIMLSMPFLERIEFTSTGILLSESAYTISCKPNTVFCVRDNYVVIKATEDIEMGQIITVNWDFRRDSCSCKHCLKCCQLNAFVCINCRSAVISAADEDKLKYRHFDYDNVFKNIKNLNSLLICKQCKTTFNLNAYENLNSVGQYYITQFKQVRNIRFLEKAIKEYKNIFQPTHIFQSYLYIMALEFYTTNRQTHNPEQLADILTKYLVIVELHFGKYSKSLLCGRCAMLLKILEMYNESDFPPVLLRVCRKLLESIRVLGDFHCISYKIHILEQVIRTNFKSSSLSFLYHYH